MRTACVPNPGLEPGSPVQVANPGSYKWIKKLKTPLFQTHAWSIMTTTPFRNIANNFWNVSNLRKKVLLPTELEKNNLPQWLFDNFLVVMVAVKKEQDRIKSNLHHYWRWNKCVHVTTRGDNVISVGHAVQELWLSLWVVVTISIRYKSPTITALIIGWRDTLLRQT